ncbi:MAG TPA: beta-galactosidase trimerization domain-containing protein [Prolixibacteraceae bacterium]|nr:beta-galactosidase trimerization domain-containing protein [Prolixibacteraceae bacterium]
MSDTPVFGAQVFIEPGQTPEEIDTWFRMLKENGMKTTRIRMFESYMHKTDDTWDYSLFDIAYKAADKYDIKVYATLFPYTEKTDIGGFKFPRDEAHLQSIALFIEKAVTHFSQYKCMYGWVLINEPGVSGKIPWTDFTKARYQEWLKQHPQKEYLDNGYPILVELTDQRFLLDYNTWYLNWLATEIKKYDTKHVLHVNNHAMFQNCAEYNFPEWRKFLTTLGGSAHASWHFGYFNRDQYAMAMSANSEIVRSGAGELPWIMTEIQGGNNTYSGMAPFCPTKYEIAQWMWVTMGTQGKGGIFWSLNPRSSGIEAGEWAMLDFQDQPSDRLIAASKVIKVIDSKPELFANAREVESGINLLYVRESLWAEKKMASPSLQNYEGRLEGGVMKSILGYFETLTEMGVNCNLKEFGEFDFTKEDYTGVTIILAHQISIPSSYAPMLENFVSKGGKLIVEGLTGFFDDNLHNTMKTGFPFANLLGGNISEFKAVDNLFEVKLDQVTLPAHFWRGFIRNNSAKVISTIDNEPIATRHQLGKGETLWIPSLLGLGARLGGNEQLARFLAVELKANLSKAPFLFPTLQKGMLMKTLRSGNSYITIIVNKSKDVKEIALTIQNTIRKPELLFADKKGTVKSQFFYILPEETMVVEWK